MTQSNKIPRVLAISSGGGHWVELRRLRPAFNDCEVTWCTTRSDYLQDVQMDDPRREPRFFTVLEANRWQKLRLLRQLAGVIRVLMQTRPDVIVSTGAAPGVFAICLGKIVLRSRTIWVQSLADTEGMSMSGKLVRRYADLWLTQWDHLAQPEGPHYRGAII